MAGVFRMNMRRVATVAVAILLYVVVLFADASSSHALQSSFYLWLTFSFSAFVSLVFLAVGSLIWLYAHDRRVALLLFSSCCACMVTFGVETAAVLNEPFFTMLTGVSSTLALVLYALLLLFFPINFLALFSSPATSQTRGALRPGPLLLRWYLGTLLTLGGIALCSPILDFSLHPALPWLDTLGLVFVAVALLGILITIALAYAFASSMRQKQQIRLFVLSVLLAFAPLLILTIIPQLLQAPAQFVIDSQISTLSMVLLPLAMGYSVLRYQVMILDTFIRRAATWIIGTVLLAMLGYLVVVFYTFLFAQYISAYVVSVAATSAILAPCTWWLAKLMTDRLFFSEILHYHRLLYQPAAPTDETLTLDETASLLTIAAASAFETSRVALFVLDEGTGYYHIRPPLQETVADAHRRDLLRSLLQTIDIPTSELLAAMEQHSSVIAQVAAAHRPLLLSEITGSAQADAGGKNHHLIARPDSAGDRLLLAPVRAQGKMIGVLLLGEHGDDQQYAGPDFEAVQLILGRFSPMLETARLYERTHQQAALLNSLYSNIPVQMFQSTEEVADAYVALAAEAAGAHAELWLNKDRDATLRCISAAGAGPRITSAETLQLCEQDWLPYFSTDSEDQPAGAQERDAPPCLVRSPLFPFAWLPLMRGDQRLGFIVLTYPCPHRFFKEETRVLLMFAQQCAAALINAAMTIELRDAYERQKELDRLKDQFIITASHELRTPLTAVQGYIELLSEYNTTLSEDDRANFIMKAHRGCDELTLLVGNIMDASRVQIDAENVCLSPILLKVSIEHVLEILEGIIRREKRGVHVDVPEIWVLADDIRLRQVLLNLVGNALKYSPVGTPLEISAQPHDGQLTVYVRDHGLGIPREEQHRLFDRFMRLDRDMNSPVRGAGLGLYICKQLIEAMGGQIWVESRGIVGEGSTFAFSLACADQHISSYQPGAQRSDISMH